MSNVPPIDVEILSPRLRKAVLAEYRALLRKPDRLLTYAECAWLYGYTYQSIRAMVAGYRLDVTERNGKKLISHKAMREYIRGKRKAGTTRAALRPRQTSIL